MALERYLFFTDLDGTLLDHHDYSYTAARPALDRLRAGSIPLIINSSKTRAEIEELRRELDNHDPFVVENGGVICYDQNDSRPDDFRGPPYERLRLLFTTLREEHGFRCRGFGDMSDDEVAALTGLSTAGASRARQRLSSEPFVWEDEPDIFSEFERLVGAANLGLTRGGRFHHLGGPEADKGAALRRIANARQAENSGAKITSVALGDSPNDLAMLEAADIAVVIPGAAGTHMKIARPAIFAPDPGPVGWNTVVQNILDGEIDLQQLS